MAGIALAFDDWYVVIQLQFIVADISAALIWKLLQENAFQQSIIIIHSKVRILIDSYGDIFIWRMNNTIQTQNISLPAAVVDAMNKGCPASSPATLSPAAAFQAATAAFETAPHARARGMVALPQICKESI